MFMIDSRQLKCPMNLSTVRYSHFPQAFIGCKHLAELIVQLRHWNFLRFVHETVPKIEACNTNNTN